MSGQRKSAVVTRNYTSAPDYCARALMLLLKKPVSKEATRPGGPDDVRKDLEDAHTATEKYSG